MLFCVDLALVPLCCHQDRQDSSRNVAPEYFSGNVWIRKLDQESTILKDVSAEKKPDVLLPKSLGGGVPHGSQNPDPISDQNI